MLKTAFDNSGQTLTRPSWAALAGEFWEFASYRPRNPSHASLPDGQGAPVTFAETVRFAGTRNEVRQAAALYALARIEHYYRQLPAEGDAAR